MKRVCDLVRDLLGEFTGDLLGEDLFRGDLFVRLIIGLVLNFVGEFFLEVLMLTTVMMAYTSFFTVDLVPEIFLKRYRVAL